MKLLPLYVLVVLAAALAVTVEPGRACSCVPPDPWDYLKRADGAFVGKLVRRETDGNNAVLTFEVEQAVKGRIGGTVKVVTASNGAACGIEAPIGTRVGLFLAREGGRWVGNLCWQVSPEHLLAAATLPAPNGRGAMAMFVSGRFGPARALALDAKGRTLAYRIGGGRAEGVSVCPGGRRVAELVLHGGHYVIEIRELPTFWLVRRLPLTERSVDTFSCVNALSEQIAIFSSDTGANGRLTRVTPGGTTTIWSGKAFYASFGRRSAYVQVIARRRTRIVTVDLRTGTAKTLGTVPVCGAYQLAPNRAETRLAGDTFCEGVGDPRLVMINLETRPTARTIPLAAHCCGATRWIGNDRFAYVSGQRIRVYDGALRPIGGVSSWRGGPGAIVGGTAFGVTLNRTLVAARLPSGPVRSVRRLPGQPNLIFSAVR